MEVGGRWSDETRSFVSQLDRARARHETAILQKLSSRRGGCVGVPKLSCAAAKAVATSLLGVAHTLLMVTRLPEVKGEHRHVGLAQ